MIVYVGSMMNRCSSMKQEDTDLVKVILVNRNYELHH